MKTELKNRILGCLGKVLSTSIDTLEPEINLRDELGMDSLAMVMLQVQIEEEFRFTFDPIEDDFERIFETFGSLYNYLEGKE
ncbi:MAG: acyl carrier protein [Lachnospiraceae bacterium]|nr:acyl carrier protein [Lachnospiraceae bacterium]